MVRWGVSALKISYWSLHTRFWGRRHAKYKKTVRSLLGILKWRPFDAKSNLGLFNGINRNKTLKKREEKTSWWCLWDEAFESSFVSMCVRERKPRARKLIRWSFLLPIVWLVQEYLYSDCPSVLWLTSCQIRWNILWQVCQAAHKYGAGLAYTLSILCVMLVNLFVWTFMTRWCIKETTNMLEVNFLP